MKKYIIPSVGFCFILLFLFVGLVTYQRRIEVDICSGRVSKSIVICGLTVKREFVETEMSKIIVSKKSIWKRDSTFSVFSPHISPHYHYHGTIHCIDMVGKILKEYSISEDRTKKLYNFIVLSLKNRKKIICILSFIDSIDYSNGKEEIEYFIDNLDRYPCPRDLSSVPKSETRGKKLRCRRDGVELLAAVSLSKRFE